MGHQRARPRRKFTECNLSNTDSRRYNSNTETGSEVQARSHRRETRGHVPDAPFHVPLRACRACPWSILCDPIQPNLSAD